MHMMAPQKHSNKSSGFTMIELIIVMVIMSVIAGMGSKFIVSSAEMYRSTSEKSKLVNRARQAVERMSRQLRLSLPNSVRVSASGRCVEFMQLVGASNYEGQVADAVNLVVPGTSSVVTAPFNLGLGTAAYASIGATSPAEIYSGSPSSIVGLGAIGTTGITTVNFSGAHTFARNSTVNRIFIAEAPTKFCVNGSNELRVHSGYALPTNGGSGLTDSAPNTGDILARNVTITTEVPFDLSPATETRGAIIMLEVPFVEGSNRIVLDHRVLIKNVP